MTLEEVREALARVPHPPCAALTPFDLVEVSPDGRVRVRFAPQPAFTNHFGNVQGGFLVAMLEVPLTIAILARTQKLCPTIEMKTSFVAPAPIGELIGEGFVMRAGSKVVFAEARLWAPGEVLVAHVTATSLVPG